MGVVVVAVACERGGEGNWRGRNEVALYEGLSTGVAVKEKRESNGLSSSESRGSMSTSFRRYLRGASAFTVCCSELMRLNNGSCSASASLNRDISSWS